MNVETKNIFIEVAMPFLQGLSFRGGIFGYGDRYDFNIIADDFAGFQLFYKRGDVAAHFVYLKFFEGSTRDNADDSSWFGIDGQFQITEATVPRPPSITGSIKKIRVRSAPHRFNTGLRLK